MADGSRAGGAGGAATRDGGVAQRVGSRKGRGTGVSRPDLGNADTEAPKRRKFTLVPLTPGPSTLSMPPLPAKFTGWKQVVQLLRDARDALLRATTEAELLAGVDRITAILTRGRPLRPASVPVARRIFTTRYFRSMRRSWVAHQCKGLGRPAERRVVGDKAVAELDKLGELFASLEAATSGQPGEAAPKAARGRAKAKARGPGRAASSDAAPPADAAAEPADAGANAAPPKPPAAPRKRTLEELNDDELRRLIARAETVRASSVGDNGRALFAEATRPTRTTRSTAKIVQPGRSLRSSLQRRAVVRPRGGIPLDSWAPDDDDTIGREAVESIMASVLPAGVVIDDRAVDSINACVGEFLNFIISEMSSLRGIEGATSTEVSHVIAAHELLGFRNLSACLSQWETSRRAASKRSSEATAQKEVAAAAAAVSGAGAPGVVAARANPGSQPPRPPQPGDHGFVEYATARAQMQAQAHAQAQAQAEARVRALAAVQAQQFAAAQFSHTATRGAPPSQ